MSNLTTVTKGNINAKYYTPNDCTLGRAQTLFTKEPITIKWIEQMSPGDVLYDVGANVGMYSVYAGYHGVKVYAFEPMYENYAILVKNLFLNDTGGVAYCLAMSDKMSLDQLYLSSHKPGGSLNSFGQKIGPFLEPRDTKGHGAVSMSIDDVVRLGLPHPNHIKIDVDGLEHLVIAGAHLTLLSLPLKTVLIEINPNLPEHQGILKLFSDAGWYLDKRQVENSTRKDGPFKGYAEHLFHKLSPLGLHTVEKIKNAEVINDPFPHIYVEDVFHPSIYQAILSNLPPDDGYKTISEMRPVKGYADRYVTYTTSSFWKDMERFMLSGVIREAFEKKFNLKSGGDEVLLIRDKAGYSIGPHTDSPHKAMSALFYLPVNGENESAGTSMYAPKEAGFTCDGTKHHDPSLFNLVKTMKYRPNSLFAFPKSDKSFHGVETYQGKSNRDVYLYDIKSC